MASSTLIVSVYGKPLGMRNTGADARLSSSLDETIDSPLLFSAKVTEPSESSA